MTQAAGSEARAQHRMPGQGTVDRPMTGRPYECRQLDGIALRQLLGLLALRNGLDKPPVNGAGGLVHLGVRIVAYLGPEH